MYKNVLCDDHDDSELGTAQCPAQHRRAAAGARGAAAQRAQAAAASRHPGNYGESVTAASCHLITVESHSDILITMPETRVDVINTVSTFCQCRV